MRRLRFLACYDYDVPVLVLFLPCTPIRVEPICFVRIFKTLKNHLSKRVEPICFVMWLSLSGLRDCRKDRNLFRTKIQSKNPTNQRIWRVCAAGETRLKKSLYVADGRVICEREGGRRRHILKGPHAEGGWAWTEHRWKRICGLMEKQATKCLFGLLGGPLFLQQDQFNPRSGDMESPLLRR